VAPADRVAAPAASGRRCPEVIEAGRYRQWWVSGESGRDF